MSNYSPLPDTFFVQDTTHTPFAVCADTNAANGNHKLCFTTAPTYNTPKQEKHPYEVLGHVPRPHFFRAQTQTTYLVEARLEMKALAVLVHGSQVPVQGSFVPFRPPTLPGRAAALEHVLQLLLAGTPAEDGLS